jgi:mRNA interferase HicA
MIPWSTFKAGKGSHLKVTLNGRNSVLPIHSKDLGSGLVAAIKKQPGLKLEAPCDTQLT